ncbi:MAG: PilZ domain-containing protein [Magnetospirillum sp. WYHS-4]
MTSDPPAATDNRVAPRRKALFGGRIFAEGLGAWDCLIRDISASGARVRVDDRTPLVAGTSVDLKVNKFEDLRRAEIMWIRGQEMGLRFLVPLTRVPKAMERFFTLVRSQDGS